MTPDQNSQAADIGVIREIDELAGLLPQFDEVICKIFGGGAAPASDINSYSLIEPVCRKLVSNESVRTRLIAALRACFQPTDDFRFLRGGLTGWLAGYLARSASCSQEDAIWCLSALEPELMLGEIRVWSDEEIERLCDHAILQISNVCARDRVLDLRYGGRGYPAGASIAKNSLLADGDLRTFEQLRRNYDLVHHGVRPGLSHACELVFRLRPNRLRELVIAGDHPVVRLLIGDLTWFIRGQDHRYTLAWVDDAAPDCLIALAIHQTFRTIQLLENDAHTASLPEIYHQNWQTDLRPPDDFRGAAEVLLSDLVCRLMDLSGLRRPKWLAELLDLAPDRDESWRQLAAQCGQHLSEIVCQEGQADTVLAAIESAVATRGRRAILIAEVARHFDLGSAIREQLYARIRVGLVETISAEKTHYPLNLGVADDVMWTEALAQSLAYSANILCPLRWALDVGRGLPLSQWDAEEDSRRFAVAVDAMWHLFQIGFVSLPRCTESGKVPNIETVHEFIRGVWLHAAFVYRRSHFPHEELIQGNAVVVAVEHGALGDEWLLEIFALPYVHPRALGEAFLRLREVENRELASSICRERYFTHVPRSPHTLAEWARLTMIMASHHTAHSAYAQMGMSILDGLGIDPNHEASAPRLEIALGLAAVSAALAPAAMKNMAGIAYHRLTRLSEGTKPFLERLVADAGWSFAPTESKALEPGVPSSTSPG